MPQVTWPSGAAAAGPRPETRIVRTSTAVEMPPSRLIVNILRASAIAPMVAQLDSSHDLHEPERPVRPVSGGGLGRVVRRASADHGDGPGNRLGAALQDRQPRPFALARDVLDRVRRRVRRSVLPAR